MLDRVIGAAQAAGRTGSVIEARLVRALAHHANGNPVAALDDLAAALADGVPAGHVRLFLDEDEAMVQLLKAAQGRPEARDQATRLLQAARPTPVAASSGQPTPEDLSQRDRGDGV